MVVLVVTVKVTAAAAQAQRSFQHRSFQEAPGGVTARPRAAVARTVELAQGASTTQHALNTTLRGGTP